MTALCLATCDKPERYIQQLVKHWSHKMATNFDAGIGVFPFNEHENAVLAVHAEGIAITLTTGAEERNFHLRGVMEQHIDRFAFREAPLNYNWSTAREA